MDAAHSTDTAVSRIAAAIGEPARTRMLFCLLDDHARTSTELAVVAGVSPSTASVHLHRLLTEGLLSLHVQGKHRYYSLHGPEVARTLESLSVLAGSPRRSFAPTAPHHLRQARTCYDHIAGALGVGLHDRLFEIDWLSSGTYQLTQTGLTGFHKLGIDVDVVRSRRRLFIGPCLDWSERKPHLAGSLGAALLTLALTRRWVVQELDSRSLEVTALGRREFHTRFGLRLALSRH
jgi:DNA-binding transcriptional ArsR family regulator